MSTVLAALVAMMGATTLVEPSRNDAQSSRQSVNSPNPLCTRVRSDDRYVIDLIRQGYNQSATFRALVDALQHSNVIVFVQPGLCAGGRIRSCLVAVAGSDHDRHIRIRLFPQHIIENGLIATIAHELQHAVEVAESPHVVDGASLAALYRRIATGHCGQGLSEECETTRALETERTVYQELQRGEGRLAVSSVSPTLSSDAMTVRSTSTQVLALIQEGAARSASLCRLIEQIAASNGIVYVEFGHCALGHLNGCLLPFIAPSTGGRYLRILVTPDRTRKNRDQLIALIAHELQHALEVLTHPEVVDVDSMRAMYSRIGVPLAGRSGSETTAAHAVQDAVSSELHAVARE
jgi:hypothetical protein